MAAYRGMHPKRIKALHSSKDSGLVVVLNDGTKMRNVRPQQGTDSKFPKVGHEFDSTLYTFTTD